MISSRLHLIFILPVRRSQVRSLSSYFHFFPLLFFSGAYPPTTQFFFKKGGVSDLNFINAPPIINLLLQRVFLTISRAKRQEMFCCFGLSPETRRFFLPTNLLVHFWCAFSACGLLSKKDFLLMGWTEQNLNVNSYTFYSINPDMGGSVWNDREKEKEKKGSFMH